MWNLEKWYRLFYLQSRHDIENKYMYTNGARWGKNGMNWEIGSDGYTYYCV